MAKETNETIGQTVPDTATTYERAKPEEESPSQTLAQPQTGPPNYRDELARNAEPKSSKKVVT